MINNRIKTAKFKLDQHRLRGSKSNLSVFEVARLLDSIRRAEEVGEDNNNSTFFSLN